MKRLMIVAATAVLVSAPGTAFAQGGHAGCQAFGQGAAAEAQAQGGLGETVRQFVPVNDQVAELQDMLCD